MYDKPTTGHISAYVLVLAQPHARLVGEVRTIPIILSESSPRAWYDAAGDGETDWPVSTGFVLTIVATRRAVGTECADAEME